MNLEFRIKNLELSASPIKKYMSLEFRIKNLELSASPIKNYEFRITSKLLIPTRSEARITLNS